jgi:hypothetical protein
MGLFCTSDKGMSWKDLNAGLTEGEKSVLDMVRADNDTVLVLSYVTEDGGYALKRSLNDLSWNRQYFENDGWTNINWTCSKSADGTLMVGNNGGNSQISMDNGKNWQALPGYSGFSGMSGKSSNGTYYVVRHSHDSVGGYWEDRGIYRLPPGGEWTYLAFDDIYITDFLVTSDDLLLVATASDLFISEDGGDSWQNFSTGLPEETGAYALLESCDGTLYLASRGAIYNVYKRPAGSDAWESMNFPTSSDVTRIYSLALMKGYLYAGTNLGVFHTDIDACHDFPRRKGIVLPCVKMLLLN